MEKERNTGKIWKYVTSYLNWNNQGGPPSQLIDKKGRLVTSPKMIAKIQNDYYIEKVNTIREQLPKEGDPLRILRSLMAERNRPDITPELEFRAVYPEEVEKIIKQLKTQNHVKQTG